MTEVVKIGIDSSGRGLYMSTYMRDWWTLKVIPALGWDRPAPVITQGAWMSKNGGGASASAGYHDFGGCLDLRVWDLTDAEVGQLIRTLRRMGAAAWLRNAQHGGFKDPHIHLVLGTDPELSNGAAQQWADYQAGRDGLASRGPDYHWRPNPLVLTPPPVPPVQPTGARKAIEKRLDKAEGRAARAESQGYFSIARTLRGQAKKLQAALDALRGK